MTTVTINFTNGIPLTSEHLDLFACGDFMRVTDKKTKKQEMIPSAAIKNIIEKGEASSVASNDRVMVYTKDGECDIVRGATVLSNSGGFLSISDDRNGTRTWLPAHVVLEIEVISAPRPRSGDAARLHFNNGGTRPFRDAWVHPTGSFVYVSCEAEGRASWFPSADISNIEFLN